MATQLFTTFSGDSQTYIAAKTLIRINRDCIVYGLGRKEKLPHRYSTTFQYTRYEKLNLPQTTLTEGVTPSNTSISISTVTAVMNQWGAFVDLSDVVEVTIKHPVLEQAITLLGEQAAETIDRECIKPLQANANVYYAGIATSRATLGASDYITTPVLKSAIQFLRTGGAHPVQGRLYWGLMDPSIEMDLLEDDTFVLAASYSNIVALQNGEAGRWMGVRWMVSNLIPEMAVLTSPSTAANATAGSLTTSTNYYIQVTQVNNTLGFEVAVSAVLTQGTSGDTSVQVTMPTSTTNTYNVYFGSTSTALYLSSSGNASAAVVVIGTVPTSGNVPPAVPAAGVTVHTSWVIGREAFAVPELMSLQTFLTPKQASDSDPLLQRRRASWKVMFKSVICNDAFLARIESASRFG